MRVVVSLLALTIVSQANAQPISQSMAQCSGLTRALSDHVSTPSRLAKIRHFQSVWTNAALEQAESEGQSNPVNWVQGHETAMYETWASRGALAMLRSPEMKDWQDYCGSLARSRGLSQKMQS